MKSRKGGVHCRYSLKQRTIRIMESGKVLDKPFADDYVDIEQGLLSLTIDPSFEPMTVSLRDFSISSEDCLLFLQ